MVKLDASWTLLDDLDSWEDICLGAGMVMLNLAARHTAQGLSSNLAVDLAITNLIRMLEAKGMPKHLTDAYRKRFFGRYEQLMRDLLTTIHRPFETTNTNDREAWLTRAIPKRPLM